MKLPHLLFQTVLATFVVWDARACHDQRRVVVDIFNGYQVDLRPVNQSSDVLNVSIGFLLQNLVELQSAHQIISIRGVFVISWTDVSLTWSPDAYGGVRNITVQQKNIWTPDIVLEDSMMPRNTLGHNDLMLTVDHTGRVVWRPSDIYNLACSIDITYFPYDTQQCPMTLITWVSNIYEIDLSYDKQTTAFGPLHLNGLWDLNGYQVSEIKSKSGNPVIRFIIEIERQPAYYIVNIFIPLVLLSAVNLVVFLLPEDCGEKIGLNITVLLTFVVFLSLLGDSLPTTSRQTSLMTIYITLLLVLSGLALISTSLVLALHDRPASTRIPDVVVAIVGFLSCAQRRHRPCRISSTKMALQGIPNKAESDEFVEADNHKHHELVGPEHVVLSWQKVARCLDRVFFVVFCLINVLAFVAVMIIFNSR